MKIKRIIILLVVAISVSIFANAESPLIKVGLKFGSTAVTGDFPLTFENGFQTGYISDDNFFIPIMFFANNKITVYSEGNSVILADADMGGVLFEGKAGQAIAVKPLEGSSAIPYVTFNGVKYADILKLSSNANGKITVVNVINTDLYIKGVLPLEIYPSWHSEALKAAAVATRTFTYHSMNGKHASFGIDLCATTCCQVYSGISKCVESTNKAVDDTKNIVLTYKGEPITAVYHAISGGITESASGAWGSNQEDFPYLTVIETPFENYWELQNGHWTKTLYNEDFEALIEASSYKGKISAPIADISVEDNTAGYLNNMTITDTQGKSIFLSTSSNIRSFFSKYVLSANFTINKTLVPTENSNGDKIAVLTSSGNKTTLPGENVYVLSSQGKEVYAGLKNAYIIDGKGYGHGVGLSQYGAQYAAKAGYSYEEILSTYYPGAMLEDYTSLK